MQPVCVMLALLSIPTTSLLDALMSTNVMLLTVLQVFVAREPFVRMSLVLTIVTALPASQEIPLDTVKTLTNVVGSLVRMDSVALLLNVSILWVPSVVHANLDILVILGNLALTLMSAMTHLARTESVVTQPCVRILLDPSPADALQVLQEIPSLNVLSNSLVIQMMLAQATQSAPSLANAIVRHQMLAKTADVSRRHISFHYCLLM